MTEREKNEAIRRGLELVDLFEGVQIERRFLAEWRKWRRVPVVSVEEAIHLSLGAEPSWADYGHTRELYNERRELASANIGLGGALEIIPGSADLRYGGANLREARIKLLTFADWAIANCLQLAPECPRTISLEPKACKEESERQQTTRARVTGILALALGRRLGALNEEGKLNVHRISETAVDEIGRHDDLKGLGRSTLSRYIKEGLEALQGE